MMRVDGARIVIIFVVEEEEEVQKSIGEDYGADATVIPVKDEHDGDDAEGENDCECAIVEHDLEHLGDNDVRTRG